MPRVPFSRQCTSPPSCLTRLRTPPSPRPCDQACGLAADAVVDHRQREAAALEAASTSTRVACACAIALLTSSRSTRVSADHCTTLSVDVAVELERPVELAVRGVQALRDVGLPLGGGVRQPVSRARPGRASASSGPAACGGRSLPSPGLGALYISVSSRAPMSSCRSCAMRARSSLRPCSTALSNATARPSCSTHAVGQARVLAGEQAPTAAREAQHQRAARLQLVDHARQARHRHHQGRAVAQHARAGGRRAVRPQPRAARTARAAAAHSCSVWSLAGRPRLRAQCGRAARTCARWSACCCPSAG